MIDKAGDPQQEMPAARKKSTRVQPNLSAERVCDEALRLIEAEGLDELSTRKLGRALGVEAMAIYWYYPSKDALLDAVVETLVGKMSGPSKPVAERPLDFIDALRELAVAYRGLAHAYPNAFPLLATRRFATENTYRFLNDLFLLAEQHGLDARTTARFYRLVASYCSGAALNELAGLREAKEAQNTTIDRSAFPRLASVWEWLGPDHYDDVFSFGLELLLVAIHEEAARGRARKTSPSPKPSPSRPRAGATRTRSS